MDGAWQPVPELEEPPPTPRPRWRRRKLAAKWSFRLFYAAIIVGLSAFLFLTTSDRGATLVVEQVLRRLPIKGEITATGARSDGLLEGVVLFDVAIRGDDGRLFLTADSALLRYDWSTLVFDGDVVFDSLEVWRPSVMVTRYPGETEFNVQRLFISEQEALDTARAALKRIQFDGVALHDGEIRVLYPAPPGSGDGWITVAPPRGDTALIRHTFSGVAARLSTAILQSPDSVGQFVAIDSLALIGQVLADPLRVTDAQGRLRFVDTRLDVSLTRLALENSAARGTVFVELGTGDDPIEYGFDLQASELDLADLAWIDPRIGAGRATGGVRMDRVDGETRMSFRTLDLASSGSRVELDGALDLTDGGFRFRALDVRAAPLALARLQPWLVEPLPVEGSVEGSATLDGTLADLATSGRVSLRRPGQGPITADFAGTLHLSETPGAPIGFTDLRATLDPFDFDILGEFSEAMKITGPGTVTVEATGRTSDAITFRAEVRHRPGDLPSSDVIASGTVRKRGQEWVLDVEASPQPLSLTALARYYPGIPLTGSVSGRVHALGLLSDLTIETDLATEAGRFAVTARVDAANPGRRYAVAGELIDFRLSRLIPTLPEPTVLNGFLDLEGQGTDPTTLTLDARAQMRPSRVGGLFVDTATLAARVRGGQLLLDTVDGIVGGIAVQARGALALQAGGAPGTVTVAFQSDSLGRLRPLVLGDVVIARDTLSALDRELLLAEGVDPDTLPTRADVEVSGAVAGEATLTGSLASFAASGSATFDRLRYGRDGVRGASVTFEGAGLPGVEGRLAATIEADSLTLRGREFLDALLTVEYAKPAGRVDLSLRRAEDEEYSAAASFELRPGEGSLALETLSLRFDTLRWAVERPARVSWNEAGVTIEGLALASADDEMRIEANGVLPRSGPADLTVHVQGLQLEQVSSLMQREDLGLVGRVDLDARVTGTGAAPIILGTFDATDIDFQSWSLTRLGGRLDYADRTLRLDVGAWQGERRVLTAAGQVPVDLALGEVARRVPGDRQMELSVVADSLPSGLALGWLTALSDIEGSVSGQFQVAGTIDEPSPSGVLTMNDAGWSLLALGVRHRQIRGTLRLRPDGVIEMAATGRSGGVATFTGTVDLHPLTDPTFDLLIAAVDFQGVARADVEGILSGAVKLTGPYTRPVITSREGFPVRIEEGVLYVEEFQRTVSIVDLADPAFFAVVDTTVVNPRPLLGAATNPFLRNMRVDVDLVAEGNTWLRSEEMNVEMGGELQVVYDRQTADLVVLGDLQAIRGTYAILGRNFQVASGAIEFVGTPGINPILNILATTRIRQAEGNLMVNATVTGTLVEPRVTLSSDDGAIAQSDLVSYLVFGVPSYQLASTQYSQLQGAAGSILGSTVEAGLSIFRGTLASQLSSLVAREAGLDYFAITTPGQILGGGLSASLYATTLEVGKYLDDNIFLTLLIRPLANRGAGATSVSRFGGARVDWELSETWTLQAFFEDRFLRQASIGFDPETVQPQKVAGLSLFRDWGYGLRATPRAPVEAPR